MISEFSRIPISYLIIISSFFIVKLTNGEPNDICNEALEKLQLPPNYADSCSPAIIFYERIEGSTKLNVMIESQDNVVIDLKDLERTKGILANNNTPIFITSQEAEDSESHSYPRDVIIMEDIGEFNMYQNFVIKTSCELYKDKSGEHFYGTIGLDTILIGIGLRSEIENEDTTYVKGDIAVITVAGGINILQSKSLPTEISTNDYESTGKTAYPELLVVADYTIVEKQTSKVELIRKLFLWFNAADMLFSPFQSPRIHLNIAGIVIAENDDSLSYLQKSLAPEGYLRLDKVMRNVEEEFYNKSNILPFECYDYAMVLTGHDICSAADTECVNGRVSRKPDTVNKSKHYKNRINTASIINTMITLPTQLLITKKIGQLMGLKLVEEEDAEKFPGIMEDYSSISTPLKWAKCSIKELTKFYNLPQAGGLWNTPTGCFVQKEENIWESSWIDPCEKALTKLQLPKGYVGSCVPVAISYERIEGSQQLDLVFQSQDGKMKVLKDLIRTDGTLANNRTPVFIATEASEYDENYEYIHDKNIMGDIGQFSLYGNYAIKTSCELYEDVVGENIYGTVGLDTIFIGIGLGWKIKRHSIEVKGIVALISLLHSKDFFSLEDSPEELSTDVDVSSEKDAYPELLLVVDYVLVKNRSSRVDLVRELVLWFNTADMLFSSLQSPRIHLNIAGILIAEADNALSFVKKSLTTDGSLSLNKVMENVEEELYDKSKKLPLDCYDYAIVLTGHNICKRARTECVNGRVSAHPNTVNKTLRYKNRVNTAAIINIMMGLPTQLLITKKLAQLMGAKLIGDEEEDECPGIMNDYSTVSTPLNWAKCSVNDLRQFSKTPEAGSLWNHPRMCLVKNGPITADDLMAGDYPMAFSNPMTEEDDSVVTTESEGISTQSSRSDEPITSTDASETTQSVNEFSTPASQTSQSEEKILVTTEVTQEIETLSTPDEIDYRTDISTDSSLTTEDGYTVTTESEEISTQTSRSDEPITTTDASETTQSVNEFSTPASQTSQSEEKILVTTEVTQEIETLSTPDEIDYRTDISTDSSLTTEDGYTVTTESEEISTQTSRSDEPITSTEASATIQSVDPSSSTTKQLSQSDITVMVTINNVTHEVEISSSSNEIDHRNNASSDLSSTTEDDSFSTNITASETIENVNQSLSITSQSSQSEKPINENKNCTGFNPPDGTLNVPLQYDVYFKANITIVSKTTLVNGKPSDMAKQFLCAFGQIAKLNLCTGT